MYFDFLLIYIFVTRLKKNIASIRNIYFFLNVVTQTHAHFPCHMAQKIQGGFVEKAGKG